MNGNVELFICSVDPLSWPFLQLNIAGTVLNITLSSCPGLNIFSACVEYCGVLRTCFWTCSR